MKNILLIEYEGPIIEQVTKLFNPNEYNILVGESGRKGYELALKYLPDLIICSTEIYEAFDSDILHELKDETGISNTPFIFLVNKNTQRREKRELTLGFDYYISKPFSSAELLKISKLAFEKFEAVSQKSEKKMNELRGSLSFALPHEFFTPLNGILGFTDVLINDYNNLNKDEVIQMLQYIHKDALRLKKLTENFLAFAQLEMISKDPEKVNALKTSYFINPKETIETTAKQIAKDLQRSNDLILELEAGSIRISEGYLKKVIQELVMNAFKFSEKGIPVIVSLLLNDSRVMISVTDSGIGMTAKQIASVGAYMQFDRRRHEQQGSGLGLIIAKKIVELHGGDFNIESTLHEGTKITMIFDNG